MSSPDHSSYRDLLAITLLPGIGPRLTIALLEQFGTPANVLRASARQLAEVPNISVAAAEKIVAAISASDVERELTLMDQHQVVGMARDAADFPRALHQIHASPGFLYRKGELDAVDAKAIAIVGSRDCTSYGLKLTEQIATGLVAAGYTIVSGLALGIDGAAHRAALKAKGRTIALMPCGLSMVYPPEHVGLAKEVEACGALLAEVPMATQARRGSFHGRNRLIAGMALATVVIEANAGSGALITARHAVEQDRQLFSVPANVDSVTNAGSLEILREGARPIRGIDDLLDDLRDLGEPTADRAVPTAKAPPTPRRTERKPRVEARPLFAAPPANLNPTQERIWTLLANNLSSDELTQALAIPVAEFQRALFELEMRKIIRRLPGNRFERA